MSNLLIDGFDLRDAADVWTVAGIAYDNTIKRTGPTSAQIIGNNNNGALYYDLSGAEEDDVMIAGFAFYAASTHNQPLFAFADRNFHNTLSGGHVMLQFNGGSRCWEIYLGHENIVAGGGKTLIWSGLPNTVFINTWHYMEMKVKIANAGGTVELRQDGSTIFTYSGDTMTDGPGICNRVEFASRTNGLSYRLDDCYLNNEQVAAGDAADDDDFWGDTRVFPSLPDGNGNYSMWDGSDGNAVDNYLLVDEAGAPVLTDYVESLTVDDIDTYTFEDLPVSVGTMRTVETRIHAAKSETGVKKVRPVIRRGSDVFGVEHTLAEDSFFTYRGRFHVDPITAAAWTITNFNNTEFGAQVRS